MENDADSLENEFEQQVILLLEDHEKKFVTNWSERETELDNVGQSTQLKINRYLNKYLNLGKKNIGVFTGFFGDSVKWFSQQLLIVVGGISLVFFTAITVMGYDWGLADESPLYYKISLMIVVYLLQIGLIYIALLKPKSKLNTKIEQFFDENNVQKNDADIKKLNDDKCSIDSDIRSINNLFEEFKHSLQETRKVVRSMSSTCEKIDDMAKFREKWYLECYKVKMATDYFGLNELKNIIVDLAKKSIVECKGSDDFIIRTTIITNICEKYPINAALMNLFVSYYYEDSKKTEGLWKRIQIDNNQLHYLTKKLLDLKELDFAKKADLNTETLQKILLKTQTFELSLIKNNVSLYLRLCSFLRNHFEKLYKECIPLKKQLNYDGIIDNIDFEKPFNENYVSVFEEELEKSLDDGEMRRALGIDVDEDTKKAYVVALMAIVLNPDINFREKVCIRASENRKSIHVLMAYHNLREQKTGNNEHFSLSDIFFDEKAEKPSDIKKKIENDRCAKETCVYMERSLSNGEWHESSKVIIQKMLEDLSDKIKNKEKFDAFKKAFSNIFKKVSINTLDRAVDAGLFSVYFILTNSGKGEFIEKVVRNLSIRNYENNVGERDIEGIKNFEDINQISLFYTLEDGSRIPKYDFDKYSASTRIGILHKDVDFSTFVKDITSDIETLLRKETKDLTDKDKWDNIGFIAVRISPSEYSFGILDKEIEKTCQLELINLDIAEKIAFLASGYLKDEQKLAVSALDNTINILDIVDQLNVFEYLSTDVQEDLSPKERKFLESQKLKDSIKEWLKINEINSLKHLSRILNNSSDKDKADLKNSLYFVFAVKNLNTNKPLLRTNNQKICVNEFLDLLESLDDVWKT